MTYAPNSIAGRDAASLIHPGTNLRTHLDKGPHVIVGSEGCRIYDDDGRDYLECFSSLWVCALGFRSERLARVAYEQMSRLGYYNIYKSHSHPSVIELAAKLVEIAPVPMSKVIFQNSGSEANETALKLCWHYHNAIGKPRKKKIISRRNAFHGHTTGAASMSGLASTHAGFDLPYPGFLHTEFPHYYRRHEAGESEAQFADRMVRALEELIEREDPETIGGFIAEPVMGAAGGVLPPETYFAKVQEVLRRHEILFIADEVVTGFGRTGAWWGSETFSLRPDIITTAKGLSGGMIPISAVLLNQRVFEALLTMSDRLGAFAHGSTFSGHPVATAVALEAIRMIEEGDLVANGRRIGALMHGLLRDLEDHPMIGGMKATGPLVSMEVVADKRTRRNFPAEAGINALLQKHCNEAGVVPRLGVDRIVFAPPLIMTEEEAHESVRRFRLALEGVERELRAA